MAVELSEHFDLGEMSRSDVALRRGLDNTPNAGEISNLVRLCDSVLEPARSLLGVPFHVNSGYRSPSVNAAVGGVNGSAHMDGRACDFVPVGLGLNHAFDLLKTSGLPFDQLILEYGAWIHLSVARVGVGPRRMVLVIP